jgi:hypothetical protein
MADMPAQEAPASEGGADVGEALSQVGQALDALAGEDPAFGEVADLFRSIVEQKMGGAPAGPKPAGGSETAEMGGNPNARPMTMGG